MRARICTRRSVLVSSFAFYRNCCTSHSPISVSISAADAIDNTHHARSQPVRSYSDDYSAGTSSSARPSSRTPQHPWLPLIRCLLRTFGPHRLHRAQSNYCPQAAQHAAVVKHWFFNTQWLYLHILTGLTHHRLSAQCRRVKVR